MLKRKTGSDSHAIRWHEWHRCKQQMIYFCKWISLVFGLHPFTVEPIYGKYIDISCKLLLFLSHITIFRQRMATASFDALQLNHIALRIYWSVNLLRHNFPLQRISAQICLMLCLYLCESTNSDKVCRLILYNIYYFFYQRCGKNYCDFCFYQHRPASSFIPPFTLEWQP